MTPSLAAACILFGVADLALLGIGVVRRSVLPTLCAVSALALGFLALESGPAGATAQAALVISVITSAVGTVLLWLGEAVWRLLDDPPDPKEGI